MTILVVDDDPVSVRLLQLILERQRFEVASASSAAEALAWLDQTTFVDVVISDQMLGGMTGLELFAAMLADVRWNTIPMILCTGAADRSTVEQALRLGIRHYIVKPISPGVLIDKVNAVLAERPLVIEAKLATMDRLKLSEVEYKGLLLASQRRLDQLIADLKAARAINDHAQLALVAARIKEQAQFLQAGRCVSAVDTVEAAKSWRDYDFALEVLERELLALDTTITATLRPHLIPRVPRPQGGSLA